jgi:3',5'-cyclic AMP phosphodiesterase CpdA
VTQLPDYSGQRIVWCALVTGLTPGTVYSLRASLSNSKLSSTYRTVPADNLTLAVGGDVGIQSNTVLLNKQLSADVDIIVLGGDIAYDDGMLSCYYSWDRLFSLFEDRFRALNRIIPIIFAVGNHDVGFNSYATTGNNQDRNKNFFKYLPQHYNQSRGVPQP